MKFFSLSVFLNLNLTVKGFFSALGAAPGGYEQGSGFHL